MGDLENRRANPRRSVTTLTTFGFSNAAGSPTGAIREATSMLCASAPRKASSRAFRELAEVKGSSPCTFTISSAKGNSPAASAILSLPQR